MEERLQQEQTSIVVGQKYTQRIRSEKALEKQAA